MQLSEIREAALDHLGTRASDPAYPSARLTRYANLWLNGLYADIHPDTFVASTLLVVDNGFKHQYSLARQSTPITAFRRALEVRTPDDTGVQLFEKRISELASMGAGCYYAITGPDEDGVLTTAPSARAGDPVFLRYAYWPAVLARDEDRPSSVPERFHWLIGLGTASIAFAQGGEGAMPADLGRMLFDGRAQLLAHVGRRSMDVTTRRTTDARPR